jgi:hypothetical protein
MSDPMKKIVTDVVASLKKMPSPEKNGKTFWDFMKEQLYSDSTWDQNDLKVIEKEIDKNLSALEKTDLTQLWESTDAGMDKLDDGKKVDSKEMREDLTGEILGQVMDRMDDNYSGGSYYQQTASYYSTETDISAVKKKEEEEDPESEKEPPNIDDELGIDEDEIFNDEDFDEEEDRI